MFNATRVREMIGAGPYAKLLLRVSGFPDIVRVGGGDLLEELDLCYSSFGIDETMVICRSNKRANRFNAGTVLESCTGKTLLPGEIRL